MSHDSNPDRHHELVSRLLDGELSSEEFAELGESLRGNSHRVEWLVDQLLLDEILSEQLGRDSLVTLVDLVNSGEGSVCPAIPTPASHSPLNRRNPYHWWRTSGWLAVVAVVVLIGIFTGRGEIGSSADAATILRTAIERHAEPIERVYVVNVERAGIDTREFAAPREMRVVTQGDRFYVAVQRGEHHWAWGKEADGAVWIALGPKVGLTIEEEEVGIRLRRISDVYSLNVESLLNDVLRHCRLNRDDRNGTHVIEATPWRPWNRRLQRVTIEVDKETKGVRRLTIQRDGAGHTAATSTFTLVETRLADEAKYRLEGHLEEPSFVLAGPRQPHRRRQMLRNWFGEASEPWIEDETRNRNAH